MLILNKIWKISNSKWRIQYVRRDPFFFIFTWNLTQTKFRENWIQVSKLVCKITTGSGRNNFRTHISTISPCILSLLLLFRQTVVLTLPLSFLPFARSSTIFSHSTCSSSEYSTLSYPWKCTAYTSLVFPYFQSLSILNFYHLTVDQKRLENWPKIMRPLPASVSVGFLHSLGFQGCRFWI